MLGRENELHLLPLGLAFERWGLLGSPRRTDGLDLHSRPLWEIFSHLGLSTAVVGWPLSTPASGVTDITLGAYRQATR